MITKDNFRNLLNLLSFEQSGNVFTKQFNDIDASLKVDFDAEELIYPEDKGLAVNQRQTCNFSDNENFVVFECVNRLLEKGYKPEHIELEPKWKVGHGASGGRADILVKDNNNKALLIIECKTEGREFREAWRKAQNGVSQLLTYAQQQRSTKFLCLYSSDLVGNKVVYENYILTLIDNDKLLEQKKDLKPLTYKDAEEVEDLYNVWKETYALDYATKGIFENDIQPYNIGKNKYTTADLDVVNSDREIQKKYHEFATIMRQHNVSGRENAFDKLVNLFLCKIVDESRNATDLKFYWKGIAYDSPFDLQDRLQKLYKDGMNEFLGEDVTYIDERTIQNAFKFVKEKPDATKQKILGYFRELKFFTNNDFAFIDVHNENLFHQNFEVLLKIVKMLQDLRLQSEHQNQFLGDMFEGFLDQGVKQSEGQFFTPSPITKFIMMSLPLEKIIETSEKPPRAIDYACGAGHFLNELAMQIKPFVEKHKKGDIKDFYNQIYGVEKEYRLSKVAKVSAFMYGQDQIHIIYGDALAKLDTNKHRAATEIKNNSFDILTANPPYSVKGFLETLSDSERAQYTLIDTIEGKSYASNNSIETFFIERAKQLLKPNGVAGIIAPSSILNKGSQKYPVRKSNNYVATREILLKYFDIIGIIELGSQTFGKTGTNTVILFLRRKDENPAPADHYQNRVNDWFSDDTNQTIFDDEHFIKNYCEHIEVDFEHYKTLLNGKPNQDLLNYEIFQDYKEEFDKLSEIKNLKKARIFKRKTVAEQSVELNKRFIEFLREIEKDKLYYFTLACENSQRVVIVKSPSDIKGQKRFLGYEWSSAKGNEGIKYFASTNVASESIETEDGEADAEAERLVENLNNLSRIESTLYDPNDRENLNKLNTYIQRNFNGEVFTIPESLSSVLSTARLVDMLDFSRTDFNKALSLSPRRLITIETKWNKEKISDICTFEYGKNLPEEKRKEGKYPVMGSNGRVGFHNEYLVEAPAIIVGRKGSVGAVVWENENCFPIDTTYYVKVINNSTNLKYLYLVLDFLNLNQLSGGAGVPGLNREDVYQIRIPIPPEEVQTKIVAECEVIDTKVRKAKEDITNFVATIQQRVTQGGFIIDRLGNVATRVSDSIDPQTQNGAVYYVGLENIESNTGRIVGNPLTTYSTIKSLKTSFKKGDVLYGKLRPNLNKVYLAEQDGICSTDILVFRFENKNLAKFYYYYFLSKQFNNEVLKTVAGQQLPRTSWTNMEVIKIPIPPLGELEKIVEELNELEANISQSQTIIDTASELKREILKRFL